MGRLIAAHTLFTNFQSDSCVRYGLGVEYALVSTTATMSDRPRRQQLRKRDDAFLYDAELVDEVPGTRAASAAKRRKRASPTAAAAALQEDSDSSHSNNDDEMASSDNEGEEDDEDEDEEAAGDLAA